VGGGHHIGPGRVDLGMDGESSRIHGAVAFDDLTLIIDTDEVGDRDMAEVDGEGVDPEKFGVLRVAAPTLRKSALPAQKLLQFLNLNARQI